MNGRKEGLKKLILGWELVEKVKKEENRKGGKV